MSLTRVRRENFRRLGRHPRLMHPVRTGAVHPDVKDTEPLPLLKMIRSPTLYPYRLVLAGRLVFVLSARTHTTDFSP